MRSARRRAAVLAAAGLCSLAALGVLILAVDLARLCVLRSEIQVFADSAARAAARELDGTAEGLARALAAVAVQSRHWKLGRSLLAGARAEFAASAAGPWEARPGAPAGCQFVRVRASGVAPLVLLPVVSTARSGAVDADAVAARPPR